MVRRKFEQIPTKCSALIPLCPIPTHVNHTCLPHLPQPCVKELGHLVMNMSLETSALLNFNLILNTTSLSCLSYRGVLSEDEEMDIKYVSPNMAAISPFRHTPRTGKPVVKCIPHAVARNYGTPNRNRSTHSLDSHARYESGNSLI